MLTLKLAKGHLSLPPGLEIDLDDLTLIVGDNGSGKSQLLQLIAKQIGPQALLVNHSYNPQFGQAVEVGQFERELQHQFGKQTSLKQFERPRDSYLRDYRRPLEEKATEILCTLDDPMLLDYLRPQYDADEIGSCLGSYKEHLADSDPGEPHFARLAMAPSLTDAEVSIAAILLSAASTPPTLNRQSDSVALDLSSHFARYFAAREFAGVDHPRLYRSGTDPIQLDVAEFERRAGAPPWDGMNDVLRRIGLSQYCVSVPRLRMPYTVAFEAGESTIEPHQLSSGERVLLGLGALAQFTKTRPSLLLLDELDALLNPTRTKVFIETIERIVEAGKTRVCVVTHSPTTVALWPAPTIYTMQRNVPRLIRTKRPDALNEMCAGLFRVVDADTRFVLVEGDSDQRFFNALLEGCQLRGGTFPKAIYMKAEVLSLKKQNTGGGKGSVRKWLGELSPLVKSGFLRGLCDRDDDGSTVEGMITFQRRTIENYIYDPLIMVLVWLDLDHSSRTDSIECLKNCRLRLNHVRVPDEDTPREMQVVLNGLLSELKPLGPLDETPVDVPLENDITIQYPNWFFNMKKNDLRRASHCKLNAVFKGEVELIRAIQRTAEWLPKEVHEKLRSL